MIEPPTLRIDVATREDIEGILLVERHCFGAAWTREQYLNDIVCCEASVGAVVRVGDEVVGFGSITCVNEQGYIPTLGVLATYRRTGLGSQLLQYLLAAASERGVEHVALEVRVHNVAARRLYEHHGFTSIGTRREYYQDPPDDAVVMRWTREGTATG